ncbi:AAA family ATPase [Streptomyces sparsogenes]|uniref:methylation-associated defense system AAA family ATPase MAD3 n=1 Tax=Streptomyces sparsogenes TaxID=67365 RepID=UPI00340AAAEC
MITRIEAYQYRCFRALAVDLGQFQVLAGPNGAGKTTLLDIPGLLGDLLRPRQTVADAFLVPQDNASVPRAHTLRELVHCDRGDTFTLTVEAQLPDELAREFAAETAGPYPPTHLRYEVSLEIFNDTLQVAEEYLLLFNEHRNRPLLGSTLQGRPTGTNRMPAHREWRYVVRRERGDDPYFRPELPRKAPGATRRVPADQLALATLPQDRDQYPAALWFIELVQQNAVSYAPDWGVLRKASPPGDRLLPLRDDGRNVPWLALGLREHDPDSYQAWVEHVQTALPQIATVDVRVRDEDRYAYFDVQYEGGHRVTSSGLSDGTLRVLALTLLPYLPEPPRILVTEEPENGIHPRAIETVVQSLASMYDTQVWVSTHSPLVLAHVDLSDVLAARLNGDGQVTVVPGDQHPRLKDWQGALDIGTLFAAGVLS